MPAIPRLAALLLLATLPACYVGTETVYVEREPEYGSDYAPDDDVPLLWIDSDAELVDFAPGEETGLFIEYASGGLWRLYATCGDLDLGDCHWDVVTAVYGGSFVGTEPHDLEADDLLSSDDLGAWMDVFTGADFDGMYVQTTPGASLEVDALLAGEPAWDYVFWVSDGDVVYGAPNNPFELVPTDP